MKMEINIGNAPVSWGIMEVASWGGQKPYGEVLDEIAQAGYTGAELGSYGYFPTVGIHKTLIDGMFNSSQKKLSL
jgi:inosose dehydratase